MARYGAIDLMKLKAHWSANGWNAFLSKCVTNLDLHELAKVRYRIQAGMEDLVKKKLNSDDVNSWFVRLNKSLEDTAKKIIRIRHPLPNDNPLNKEFHIDGLAAKRKRDDELMAFLKRSSY